MDIRRRAKDPDKHVPEVPLNRGSEQESKVCQPCCSSRTSTSTSTSGGQLTVGNTIRASRVVDYVGEAASAVLQIIYQANTRVLSSVKVAMKGACLLSRTE